MERLSLLKEATDRGQKISLIANLSNQDIQELIDEEVKEKVQENTYIELQNKLRDIYRIIK